MTAAFQGVGPMGSGRCAPWFRVMVCSGAIVMGTACSSAPAPAPAVTALLPAPGGAPATLAELERIAVGPGTTAVRVSGKLAISWPHRGNWPVALLVTRAGGVRLEAGGDEAFELASDGFWVQGHLLGNPIETVRVGDLPDPDRGVWADFPLPVLVGALLPSPLPRPRAGGSDLLAVAYVGPEAHLQQLRRSSHGWSLRRQVVIHAGRLRILRIDRYDAAGILRARIRYRGSVPAPWPFPAHIDLQTSSFRALLEIETVSEAGPLRAADFRLEPGHWP